MVTSSNFSKIKVGQTFRTKDGETWKKIDALIAENTVSGIEQYASPIFDRQIVAPAEAPEAKPKKAAKPKAKKASK